MFDGIMKNLGVGTGILSLSVMLSLFAFIVVYLWYLRRALDRLDRELASVRAMLASGTAAGAITEYLNKLNRRLRIRVLNELIEQDCYTGSHTRIGDIRKLAGDTGFLSVTRDAARSRNQWNRAVAVRTLSALDDRESIPLIAEVLDKHEFKPELFAAAIALARFGEKGYAVKAMQKIYDARHPNRDMIFSVLTEFGARDSGIVDLLDSSDIPDDFKSAISDVIGVQKVTEDRPAVEKLLGSTGNPELKIHLIEALEKIGTLSSCDIILKCIDDKDFRVRLKAVNALERIAGEKYMDTALRMLSDQNVFVRRNAAEAVSRMGAGGLAQLDNLAVTGSDEIKDVVKVILIEKKFKRIRWRFRYGESYA